MQQRFSAFQSSSIQILTGKDGALTREIYPFTTTKSKLILIIIIITAIITAFYSIHSAGASMMLGLMEPELEC
jgi:hypothetical protein